MLDSFSKSILLAFSILSFTACSTESKHSSDSDVGGIENPFGNYSANSAENSQNITLRTKRGDRSVEVSLPQDQNSEIQMPMNPKFAADNARTEDRYSNNGMENPYAKQKATHADREIASTFSDGNDPVNDAKKREIEFSLGLQASDELPNMDESYLAKIDGIKQLFHAGRFEATLIEIDHLVKDYPTNGRLFEMRGTVLDRLGYSDLAIKSWKQAMEFEPKNFGLKKMIEKKEQQRNVASQKQ